MSEALVIYDGDCAFCSSTVRMAQRLMKNAPEMQPHQFLDLEKYGTNTEACDKALHFISKEGKIYLAHEAVSQILVGAGWPWKLLGLLLRIPGIKLASSMGYRLVATNRHRLPGGTPTCKPKYLQ